MPAARRLRVLELVLLVILFGTLLFAVVVPIRGDRHRERQAAITVFATNVPHVDGCRRTITIQCLTDASRLLSERASRTYAVGGGGESGIPIAKLAVLTRPDGTQYVACWSLIDERIAFFINSVHAEDAPHAMVREQAADEQADILFLYER
jgi:hypothetical protein